MAHPYLADSLMMPPSYVASGPVLDATGEKFAIVGRVWWTDRGSHDIRTIGWRNGAVTSAGGSNIDLSLQDLDAATGAPTRPDGNKDQTANFDLGTLVADTWNQHTLASDRTGVAHGSTLGVVWEYDAGGRLGADSLEVDVLTASVSGTTHGTMLSHLTASWAAFQGHAVLVLIAADGTIGTLGASLPVKALNTHTFNSGSTPDELANQIEFNAPITLEGVEVMVGQAAAADLSVILYEGTTPTACSVTVDEDTAPAPNTSSRWRTFWFATPCDLTANTAYYVAIRPDTTNNITLNSFDANAASHLDLIAGQDFHYWDRVNGGAWSNETTTRWIEMRLLISMIDDGVQTGGAPLIGPGGLIGN